MEFITVGGEAISLVKTESGLDGARGESEDFDTRNAVRTHSRLHSPVNIASRSGNFWPQVEAELLANNRPVEHKRLVTLPVPRERNWVTYGYSSRPDRTWHELPPRFALNGTTRIPMCRAYASTRLNFLSAEPQKRHKSFFDP